MDRQDKQTGQTCPGGRVRPMGRCDRETDRVNSMVELDVQTDGMDG